MRSMYDIVGLYKSRQQNSRVSTMWFWNIDPDHSIEWTNVENHGCLICVGSILYKNCMPVMILAVQGYPNYIHTPILLEDEGDDRR